MMMMMMMENEWKRWTNFQLVPFLLYAIFFFMRGCDNEFVTLETIETIVWERLNV